MTWQEWQAKTLAQREQEMDRSALDTRFDRAYRSGERVEVLYQWGTEQEIKRGYVGRTTGWKPVYILLPNSRSRGSSDILDHHVIDFRKRCRS